MAAITGLDHVILAVAALDAARDTWRRLGFTVTPRGRHIGWGTANHCIMLEADYIELLGVLDPSQFDNGLGERLARDGEGLLGIALATRSADSAASAFEAAGAGGEPARDLARLLDLPEGPVQPSFRLAYPARRDAFGLPLFATEHRTSGLLRRPEWERHANGATGILRLDLPTPLTEPALATWAALDGTRREGDSVAIGGFTLGAGVEPTLHIATSDLDSCEAALRAGHVAHGRHPGEVRVPPLPGTGLALRFAA
ncbi:VOC family protein [Inquilinus sp. NPDC058860]|uniref:VOC family protein n=1 Tax=Inquilinus sp. NPDC058860 TaxID=3346652 RepID=UPI0036B70F0C